jgi:hypothetical protein
MSSKCNKKQILNPKTNRCVLKSGKIGKELLKSKSPKVSAKNKVVCKPNQIFNPKTNRCVLKSGKIGKELLKSKSPKVSSSRTSPVKTPIKMFGMKTIFLKERSPYIDILSAPKKFKNKKFNGLDELDTYASILYLGEIFKDECIIIPHSHSKFKINKNINFSDITLTWDQESNSLIEPHNFWKYIDECYNNTKRFIMIPFGFECKNEYESHANFLIYDKKENSLERFEPNGSYNYSNCIRRDIDDILKKIFRKKLDPNLKYYNPADYLPYKGLQYLQEQEKDFQQGKYYLKGYCGVWAAYYAMLRLKHPNVDRKKIINRTIKALNNRNQSYSEFIRDYGQIVRQISNILRKSKNPQKDFVEYIIDLNTYKKI